MTKRSAPILSPSLLRPSLAAFVVAAGTAFSFTACSSSEDPEGGSGSGGAAGTASGAGGTTGKAGSSGSTSGGAGAGGSTAGTSAGGKGGAGGSTGGTTAGTSTAGTGGSTGGAGAGGTGTAGVAGSMGGAGAGGMGGTAMGGAGSGGTGGKGGAAGGGGSGGSEDLDIMAEQFECIEDWDKVLGFRINNLLGHLPEALYVAENGGVYPVGTVIQHLPTEAMVKRRAGFSAATKDWEFFLLTISAQGTTIAERGTTMIETSMGATCVSCHDMAPDEFDFVCNTYGDQGPGNCGFDFMESQLSSAIMNDPRCP